MLRWYVDQDGWVYFAGRTSDWLRVEGENFPATPIEAIVARYPDVVTVSVYGVPPIHVCERTGGSFRIFTTEEEEDALRRAFVSNGRRRMWDL